MPRMNVLFFRRQGKGMITAKIAVVDDDAEAVKKLCGYIDRYGGESGKIFDVKTFSNLSVLLSEYRNGYDILFMDVELPDGSGIDAAGEIRKRDEDVIIVFVTNMAQFAVRGYEVRAMDYVVKPISYYNFASKFGAALAALDKRRDVYVWISNKEGKTRLNAAQIVYVEVYQHMLVYHTVNGATLDTGDAKVVRPSNPTGDSEWKTYDEVFLGKVQLQAGVNVVTLTVITDEEKGSNIDYLRLEGETELSLVDLNTTLVEDTQRFEAEFAEITASDDGRTPGLDSKVCTAQDGSKSMMIGMNNLVGAGAEFTVKNDGGKKTVALYAAVTKRTTENVPFADVFNVFVNGEKLEAVAGNIPVSASDDWRNSEEVRLCELELEAGAEYTILFKVINDDEKGCNFDYIRLETVA